MDFANDAHILYVDGIPIATNEVTGQMTVGSGGRQLALGRAGAFNGLFFDGDIGYFAVVKTNQTASEIYTWHTNSFTGY